MILKAEDATPLAASWGLVGLQQLKDWVRSWVPQSVCSAGSSSTGVPSQLKLLTRTNFLRKPADWVVFKKKLSNLSPIKSRLAR